MSDAPALPRPDQPLRGIRVIEIGHSVAAPFCGQVLADLGAEVIKIENPEGGDDARHWGPPFVGGTAATFHSLNRNKRTMAVDLKDEEKRAALEALIGDSDVLVQNMRPGLMERYGLGADALCAKFPRLICCNLGAYGDVGPLRRHTGYDPLMQAFSGIMSVTGEAGRPPVRVGPSIIDQGTGMWCVIGILSALMGRAASGRGCRVDTSLFETGLSWMTVPIGNAVASGKEPGKSGSETPMLAPYRAFMAEDRHIVIAAGNNNLFRRLVETLGHPEWADDPRFALNADRVANRETLNAMIEAVVQTRPSTHWTQALDAVGVPCAPVNRVSEVLAHPQTEALGMILPAGDPHLGLVATPLRFDGIRPSLRSLAPAREKIDSGA
ncbi:CaiB/BaiF CoA transferase family protein [Pseudodonghicola sp.]|uniref:CaiB/BaiF CoA transferase family protein n=1 Tax=Pseudodonghicola sp. TaxID=1969463 RepID=UPI003A9778ED